MTLTATTDETVEEQIRHGSLDLAITSKYGPALEPDGKISRLAISEDRLRVCVPVIHPLASASSCKLAQLRKESWLLNPSDALGRIVVGACEAAGFTPHIIGFVDHAGTALGLVGLGWGVTVAPELTPSPRFADIARIPVDEIEVVRRTVVLVREGEQRRPEIALVIDAIQSSQR